MRNRRPSAPARGRSRPDRDHDTVRTSRCRQHLAAFGLLSREDAVPLSFSCAETARNAPATAIPPVRQPANLNFMSPRVTLGSMVAQTTLPILSERWNQEHSQARQSRSVNRGNEGASLAAGPGDTTYVSRHEPGNRNAQCKALGSQSRVAAIGVTTGGRLFLPRAALLTAFRAPAFRAPPLSSRPLEPCFFSSSFPCAARGASERAAPAGFAFPARLPAPPGIAARLRPPAALGAAATFRRRPADTRARAPPLGRPPRSPCSASRSVSASPPMSRSGSSEPPVISSSGNPIPPSSKSSCIVRLAVSCGVAPELRWAPSLSRLRAPVNNLAAEPKESPTRPRFTDGCTGPQSSRWRAGRHDRTASGRG